MTRRFCQQVDYLGEPCPNFAHGRNLCNTHLSRLERGQDLMEPIKKRRKANMGIEELINYVYENTEEARGCFIYQGIRNKQIRQESLASGGMLKYTKKPSWQQVT